MMIKNAENSNYTEIKLELPYEIEDEVISILIFQDFEGFIQEGSELTVYKEDFDLEIFEDILSKFDLKIISCTKIEHQNWNKSWEESYESVSIGNYCHIFPNFREPEEGFKYYIKITPQMSFGTGHHETTQLVVELTENIDFQDRLVLDMGCGTGILGILASKLGAKELVLIDFDPICVENSQQNCVENNIENFQIILGGSEVIPKRCFDVIFANINRNILLEQGASYSQNQKEGGYLFLSGYFDFDSSNILAYFQSLNYKIIRPIERNNWQAVLLQKH